MPGFLPGILVVGNVQNKQCKTLELDQVEVHRKYFDKVFNDG